MCKGPEVGKRQTSLRNGKETRKLEKSERWDENQTSEGLLAVERSLGFVLCIVGRTVEF